MRFKTQLFINIISGLKEQQSGEDFCFYFFFILDYS